MVNKLKLKCSWCGKEIANVFFYERKGEQIGYLHTGFLHCNKCGGRTELIEVGLYK